MQKLSAHDEGQAGEPVHDPSAKSGSSLYRAPTWARNINFDNGFDLKSTKRSPTIPQAPTQTSSSSSPVAMMGVALGGASNEYSPDMSTLQQHHTPKGEWAVQGFEDDANMILFERF